MKEKLFVLEMYGQYIGVYTTKQKDEKILSDDLDGEEYEFKPYKIGDEFD